MILFLVMHAGFMDWRLESFFKQTPQTHDVCVCVYYIYGMLSSQPPRFETFSHAVTIQKKVLAVPMLIDQCHPTPFPSIFFFVRKSFFAPHTYQQFKILRTHTNMKRYGAATARQRVSRHV